MRKGLLAGLSGLVCVAAVSCGEEEENPKITIPDAVESASTALALRITGPYSPNDDMVSEMLGRIANSKLPFVDVITRGGLPSGALTANVAGSAAQQIKALLDAGGPLPVDEAVDTCGNPMLAAFITPEMAQDVFTDLSDDQILGLATWPGVCAGDINCDTVKQGKWEIGFSRDHGDGNRDLVVTLSPVAGPQTQPAFQGHLLGYMLTPNNTGNHMATTSLYGNIRSLTLSAFGLVKFAKAGISLRPSAPLPGLPTRVWAFPAGARTLAGADLIVGIQAYEFCGRSWAETFGAAQPYGCSEFKSLVLDTTSRQGAGLWTATDAGDDIEKTQELGGDLDDWVATFEYQLKTQIACPDVSEPSWVREDIPLGSVEVFQCPDGDIDRCIAFHDMEDYWCELGPWTADEAGVEVEAELPMHVTGSAQYTGTFQAHTTQNPRTITYTVGATAYTIEWGLAGSFTENPLTAAQVAAHLQTRDGSRPDGGARNLNFSVDEETDRILVEAARDLGPGVGFTFDGTGTMNGQLSLSGTSARSEPTLAPLAGDHYTVTAVNTDLDFAYVKVVGTSAEPTVVYVDQPSRVLGVFGANGNALTVTPRTDGHCATRGNVAYPITTTAFLKLDLGTDGEDTIRLVSSNIAVNVQ